MNTRQLFALDVNLLGLALVLASVTLARADEPLLRIAVESGEHARLNCPLSFAVPEGLDLPQDFQLVEAANTLPIPAQLEADTPSRVAFVLPGETPAGAERQFELRTGPAPGAASWAVTADEKAVHIGWGDRPVLVYHCAHVEPPAGIDPKNGRSAYIHPLFTPAGRVVTDEFPPDHPHQSGLFLAYTKTEFEGRSPNFWDLVAGTGRVRFGRLLDTASGPVFAGFRAEHEHVDLTVPNGIVALREEFGVRVWQSGGAEGVWLLDLVSTQRTAGDSPLKLPQYHYGGAAIRGAREWGGDRAVFRTAEGKGRLDGNHTRTNWVDLSGPAGDAVAGIAMLSHPDNFRHPEPVRLHPTMPYLVFTPSFLGDWEIQADFVHIARYRFVIHDGELAPETANRLWQDYAHPPQVRIVAPQQ